MRIEESGINTVNYQVVVKEDGKEYVRGLFESVNDACKFGAVLLGEGCEINIRKVGVISVTSEDFIKGKVRDGIVQYNRQNIVVLPNAKK